jgi:hypothetical protein
MATFARLRALHALIGDALDDIERIFVSSQPSTGPADEKQNRTPLDFPSLDEPYDPLSPAEALLSHPTVVYASKLVVSASGQLTAMVQQPFLTICDATLGVSDRTCWLAST